MNAPFDPTFQFNEKFAVGQPVSRKEDPALLRGEGRYSDDLNRPGQLYGVMVRSRIAHGELRSIDTDTAREMPGVRAVITAADLVAAGIKNMPAAAGKHRDGTPAAAASSGHRPSALRRRANRDGRRGDRKRGQRRR
jgi:carbon-monoxide dehydrogenase large subunit